MKKFIRFNFNNLNINKKNKKHILNINKIFFNIINLFNNILKNAAAYSYQNSDIAVCARSGQDGVTLTFTNQGDPIPEHQKETIFEKFYRLDSSRSTQTGGSGLGLAIAKEIVTAHHGSIFVESNMDATTFTVFLPQTDYHTKS